MVEDTELYVDEQPDHGEGHVRSMNELEINAWYTVVFDGKEVGRPFQVKDIPGDGTVCLSNDSNQLHPEIESLGITARSDGRYNSQRWLKRVGVPE